MTEELTSEKREVLRKTGEFLENCSRRCMAIEGMPVPLAATFAAKAFAIREVRSWDELASVLVDPCKRVTSGQEETGSELSALSSRMDMLIEGI